VGEEIRVGGVKEGEIVNMKVGGVALCVSVVSVCCSAMQCVAECCIALQRVAEIYLRGTHRCVAAQFFCVAGCCSVLQCVAACCSALQCVAVRCSALQCVAVRYSAMQCVAEFSIVCARHTPVCDSVISVRYTVLQCFAVCCSVLQCVAVCCSVLQNF